MTRTLCTLVIAMMLCLICHISIAQPNNSYINDVIMPAPEAASLGKFGDIPVSYFTGIPNIGIPIYTVTDGPLSLPISINYHASGVRVAETASWAGLGWSLNAGGMITRTILGLKDETVAKGYYYKGDDITSINTNLLDQIATGGIDAEPDLFSFSFAGYSGKFLIDSAHNIHLFPKQDLRIEFDFAQTGTEYGGFRRFRIITPDGNKYYFGNLPTAEDNKGIEITSTRANYGGSGAQWEHLVSSWKLVRIESFDANWTVLLDYDDEQYSYTNLASCTESISFCYDNSGSTTGAASNGGVNCSGYLDQDINRYLNRMSIAAKRLSKIYSRTDTVNFITTGTNRLDLDRSYMNISQTQNRAQALEYIEIKTGAYCHKWKLHHDYFKDGSNPDREEYFRLKLNSLQKLSCDETIDQPPYLFHYLGPENADGSTFIINRLSRASDHWGFYNGSSSNEDHNYSLNIPSSMTNGFTRGESNRNTDPASMKVGVLHRIVYPTGGASIFEYGANRYLTSELSIIHEEIIQNHYNHCIDTASVITRSIRADQIPFAFFQIKVESTDPQPCDAGPAIATINVRDPQADTLVGEYFIMTHPWHDSSHVIVDSLHKLGDFSPGIDYDFTLTAESGWAWFDLWSDIVVDTVPAIKYAGGLRIEKKITSTDSIADPGDQLVTYHYHHENQADSSSGRLFIKPFYAYTDKQATVVISDSVVLFNAFAMYFQDMSLIPLSTFECNHLGYKRVEERSANGTTVYHYDTRSYPIEFRVPLPPSMTTVENGKLLSKHMFSSSGDEVSSTSNSAAFNTYPLVPGLMVKARRGYVSCGDIPQKLYSVTVYSPRTDYYLLESVEHIKDEVEVNTAYTYDPYRRLASPLSESLINSDGKVHKTVYQYPLFQSGRIADSLVAQNRIIPTETLKYVDDLLVDGSRTNYNFFDNSGLPSASGLVGPYLHTFDRYELSWDNTGTPTTGLWQQKGEINNYDLNYSKPTSFTQTAWLAETYNWDSNGLIQNRHFKDFTWSYAYHPGTRLVSTITDIDSQQIHYHYDDLLRLTSTVARDSHVISQSQYGYGDPDTGGNYIRSSIQYTPTIGSNLEEQAQIAYYDGHGRGIQQIQIGHSPSGKDVVHITEYDSLGRPFKTYEPIKSIASDGSFVSPIPPDMLYTLTAYENSPLNRVVAVTPPAWYTTHNKFESNSANEVYDFQSEQFFTANSLMKSTSIDPNGNRNMVFTDKKGREVCKSRVDSAGMHHARTYYLYDDKDRLITVLPPGTDLSGEFDEMIYHYTYNEQDNIITKEIPGKDPILFQYNDRNLVEFSKDGIHPWIRTYYDDYGRVLSTFLENPNGSSPDNLPLPYPTLLSRMEYDGNSAIEKGKPGRQWVRPFWIDSLLYTCTKYDAYGRVDSTYGNHHLNYADTSGLQSKFLYDFADNVLVSSSNKNIYNTAVVTEDRMLLDEAGRLWKQFFTFNNSSRQLSRIEYTLKDEIKTKHLAYRSSAALQQIDYSYLPNGFLAAINQPDLGELVLPYPPCVSPGGVDPTETNPTPEDLFYLGLAYDTVPRPQKNGNIGRMRWRVRGRDIQEYDLKYDYLDRITIADYREFNEQEEEKAIDRYSSTFSYADALGNLSGINRKGPLTDEDPCALSYTIDSLSFDYFPASNRLKDITESAAVESRHEGYKYYDTNEANYTYDQNGNITYDPSRRMSIKYNLLNLPDSFLFHDGKKVVFTYDAQGVKLRQETWTDGMLVEKRDYIDGVELVNDHLELVHHPEGRILFSGSPAVLVLSDTIRHENKEYYAGSIVSSNVIMDSSDITFTARDSILMLDNFTVVDDQSSYLAQIDDALSPDYWQWEYYIRDHLGNLRIVFSDLDNNGVINVSLDSLNEVLEEYHYYPFGMNMKGPWLQRRNQGLMGRYGYNGKEKEGLSGYLMFEARNYDPGIGRFTGVDPISDQFPHVSTFNYAENSPITFIDLHGLQSAKYDILVNTRDNLTKSPEDVKAYNKGYRKGQKAAATAAIGIGSLFLPGPEDIVFGAFVATKVGRAVIKFADDIGGLAKELFKGSDEVVNEVLEQSIDATKNRVKLRKATKNTIKENAPKTEDGTFIDPNTFEPIEGPYDIGHKTGQEWRTRKKMHQENGSTRKEVIEAENDPELYQIEDRTNNRSHKYEKKDN